MPCNFEGKIPGHGFFKNSAVSWHLSLRGQCMPGTQGKSRSNRSGSHCSLWNTKIHFYGQGFPTPNFNSRFNPDQLCDLSSSCLEFLYLQSMDNAGKIFVSVWLSSSVLLSQFLQNICHFQMENATKELDLVRHFKNSLLMTSNLIDHAQEMENLLCYSN